MSDRPNPPGKDPEHLSVLFVCLGNICRSPLAEGAFRHLVHSRGLNERYRIDSAGTGSWHAGERPDRRARQVASRNGVTLEGVARQVSAEDFASFDWIIAMDGNNLADLKAMMAGRTGGPEIKLLRDFDPQGRGSDVPDPYYGGPDGFDQVFEMVRRSAGEFLEHLEARHGTQTDPR